MRRYLAKIFTILLFVYSFLFSFALIFGALSSGLNLGNVLTITLFLPVLYYFLREISWQTGSVTRGFALLPFLAQRNGAFIATLVLFVLSLSLTILKAKGMLI